MVSRPDATGRECSRCGRTTTPRGREPPRYCAVCGNPLLDWPERRARRSGGAAGHGVLALAALFFGVMSLAPACGFPFAIPAVLFGYAAGAGPQPGGRAGLASTVARVGMALGALSVLLWFLRYV